MRLNLNYYYMKECTALDKRYFRLLSTLYQQDPEHQTSSCPTALKSGFLMLDEFLCTVTGKRSIAMHKFTV